ncbi:MAG: acetylglutamate kinase [Candidatus Omnitrophica bacterium]|nr:acetylglutamate kinase [Candidatus Omnitrophota bacterium]MCF7877280.1 acetylglutamate kinase [Candidatus Omnitrophota bacterium]MCF7878192.1 acetylglutamate kinase [Candidatus Omnitrophota bacterium]MCF7892684.1 acetylglutamate kinase [Candidatus Omnitrophota bacterium]
MKEAIKKADILIEALPYIKKFHKKIFVIKYGGSILGEERVRSSVLEDIAFLKFAGIRPVVVHGGGPNITEKLKESGIETDFFQGMRVTDKKTLEVVEEELNSLNSLIANEIETHSVKAKKFRRKDAILQVEKKKADIDLGYVGNIIDFDKKKLEKVVAGSIPVICPMGVSKEGEAFNINADEAAYFLASRLSAEKLVILTDVPGVMRDSRNKNSLISTINLSQAEDLIKNQIVSEGMVPKIRAAASALKSGVKKAHIVDAKISHALLLEIFTKQGICTEIVK